MMLHNEINSWSQKYCYKFSLVCQLKFSWCSQLASEAVEMKTLSSIIILVIISQVSSSSHPHGESKQILSMIDINGTKQYITETFNIEEIFLHPEVRDRKIVVLSVIGAYRKGKSFFLDYCLRFLYANVSKILF